MAILLEFKTKFELDTSQFVTLPALIGTVVIGLSSVQYYYNDMKSLANQQTHKESNVERLGEWLPLLNALIGASLLWVLYHVKRPD